MPTPLGLAAVVLVPAIAVTVMLVLAAWAERARAARAARQIAVTDAIHRELGAVAAPVARGGLWSETELRIALPLDRPDLVGAVTTVAHRALADHDGDDAARTTRIVLVPAETGGHR